MSKPRKSKPFWNTLLFWVHSHEYKVFFLIMSPSPIIWLSFRFFVVGICLQSYQKATIRWCSQLVSDLRGSQSEAKVISYSCSKLPWILDVWNILLYKTCITKIDLKLQCTDLKHFLLNRIPIAHKFCPSSLLFPKKKYNHIIWYDTLAAQVYISK